MDELDLTISLFVAPVFEAEKPCEPEPVEGGAWLSSEITKWQDDDILRSCPDSPLVFCAPQKVMVIPVQLWKLLKLCGSTKTDWTTGATHQLCSFQELEKSFPVSREIWIWIWRKSFPVSGEIWLWINEIWRTLQTCGDEGQDGAEEDADLFLQFGLPANIFWNACKHIFDCLQIYFWLSANIIGLMDRTKKNFGPDK